MGYLKRILANAQISLFGQRSDRRRHPVADRGGDDDGRTPPDNAPLLRPMNDLIEAVYQQQHHVEIQKDVKKIINNLLDSHPNLLSLPPPKALMGVGEECDTLWRWLIKNDHLSVITHVAFSSVSKNWTIPTNKIDQNNGSSLFTDPTITMSYEMFCTLHGMTGEMFNGIVNKMTNESVLHILAKKNDVYGNGMALKIMKEVVVDSSDNIDPDLVDKVEGKTALDYALSRGDTIMARLLVGAFGADWGQAENKIDKNTTECVKNFLNECRLLYGITPNAPVEMVNDSSICVVCLESIKEDMYKMDCCGNVLHTECLRKSLRRPVGGASCMFCRKTLCDELCSKMPSYIGMGSTHPPLSLLGRYVRGAGVTIRNDRRSGGIFSTGGHASYAPSIRALIAIVDYIVQ